MIVNNIDFGILKIVFILKILSFIPFEYKLSISTLENYILCKIKIQN